jgi:hypothetical protein
MGSFAMLHRTDDSILRAKETLNEQAAIITASPRQFPFPPVPPLGHIVLAKFSRRYRHVQIRFKVISVARTYGKRARSRSKKDKRR